jgi:hypothetical protein
MRIFTIEIAATNSVGAASEDGDTQTQITGIGYFLYCNVKVMAHRCPARFRCSPSE